MAGHSKWANIKHKKAKTDAKKGKVFSRLAKEIITSVKLYGNDPKTNARLRVALQKAKEANMPNENVERNIKKASSQDALAYNEVSYEFYGSGGVGIIALCMTDNKNRLATEMRIISNKTGATIATPGAVAFNFDRKGVIEIGLDKANEEDLFLQASEAGADNFEATEESYLVLTNPEDLHIVAEKLREKSIPLSSCELEMMAKSFIECSKEDQDANLALIARLEDLDDVDHVFHNMQV